jgi:hypothetical protein
VGRVDDALDPSRLTKSGVRCLEELAYVATLGYDALISTEWVVVSCTTSVETHFNRILEALVDDSGLRGNPFGNALLDQTSDDIFKNWESRLRWLNRGFGITITGDPAVQRYLSLVDLRNALVHGQGELTPLQQRNFVRLLSLKDKLKRTLGVEFRGSIVVMDHNVQVKAIQICREVTMHVDTAMLASYPSLMVLLLRLLPEELYN